MEPDEQVENGEPLPKVNLSDLSQAPEIGLISFWCFVHSTTTIQHVAKNLKMSLWYPVAAKLSYNFVVLKWPEVRNQRSYIIEEKDEYGIGRVYVGAAATCRLSVIKT